MFDFSTTGLIEMLLRVPVLVLALTLHEFAHAWTANRLGDPTARYQGRITLNPLHHLDPLGAICLLFAPIGWAKPVPVNPLNFRNPGRDDILVSAAGPGSNLAQAIFYALLLRLPWQRWALNSGSVLPLPTENPWIDWVVRAQGLQQLVIAVWLMIYVGVMINVGLTIFNMLPLFPLDGHHIARENLHGEARDRFIEFQQYGPFILLGLVALDSMLGRKGPITWPISHVSNLFYHYISGLGS